MDESEKMVSENAFKNFMAWMDERCAEADTALNGRIDRLNKAVDVMEWRIDDLQSPTGAIHRLELLKNDADRAVDDVNDALYTLRCALRKYDKKKLARLTKVMKLMDLGLE
jgi:3-dehydroquinate dehydratase